MDQSLIEIKDQYLLPSAPGTLWRQYADGLLLRCVDNGALLVLWGWWSDSTWGIDLRHLFALSNLCYQIAKLL